MTDALFFGASAVIVLVTFFLYSSEVDALRNENRRLRDENGKLKKELDRMLDAEAATLRPTDEAATPPIGWMGGL